MAGKKNSDVAADKKLISQMIKSEDNKEKKSGFGGKAPFPPPNAKNKK